MDIGYPYPQKNICGYLIISITVPADTEFNHTHIQWIIIRGYLPIPVPIAIPSWEGWGYDSTAKNEEETRRTMEVAHWRRRPSPEPNRNPSIDGE
jgi:hypothetical protein